MVLFSLFLGWLRWNIQCSWFKWEERKRGKKEEKTREIMSIPLIVVIATTASTSTGVHTRMGIQMMLLGQFIILF